MDWQTFVVIAAILAAVNHAFGILDKLYVYGRPALLKLRKQIVALKQAVLTRVRLLKTRDRVIDVSKEAPVTFSASNYNSVKLIYPDRVVSIKNNLNHPRGRFESSLSLFDLDSVASTNLNRVSTFKKTY